MWAPDSCSSALRHEQWSVLILLPLHASDIGDQGRQLLVRQRLDRVVTNFAHLRFLRHQSGYDRKILLRMLDAHAARSHRRRVLRSRWRMQRGLLRRACCVRRGGGRTDCRSHPSAIVHLACGSRSGSAATSFCGCPAESCQHPLSVAVSAITGRLRRWKNLV